jgi:predicted membrane-bound mannosyltransferase
MADEPTPDGDEEPPSDGGEEPPSEDHTARPPEEAADSAASSDDGPEPSSEEGSGESSGESGESSGESGESSGESGESSGESGESSGESGESSESGSRGRVGADGTLASLADRFGMSRRPFAAVLAVVSVGLVARLLWLGARPMHYDEARVAYWGLNAVQTGVWQYRPVVHGPLMQHFNRLLFPLLGPGDFPARLPVALIGALLPLSALLFRDHLRDYEVAVFATLLAFNPLLLYYSRYMRSDLLVAAFALVTLGALVRLYETHRPGYLYAAGASFALAFASKENAVVYVLCWGGMLGLVAGLEVLDPRRFDSRAAILEWGLERVEWARERATGGAALGPLGHATGAVLLFALVTVFMFGRRAPPGEGVSMWHSAPTTTVRYVVGDIVCGLEFWTPIDEIPVPRVLLPQQLYDQTCHGFPEPNGPFANYERDMGRQLQVVGKTAISVAALAVVGVVSEFRNERPRVLVPAAFYWGLASLVGYPVGADITYPAWVAIHAVVPLALPAAAGAVALGEWTVEEARAGHDVPAGALALALLLVAGTTAGVAVHHSYVEPTGETWSSDGQMVQFAQPEMPLGEAVDATRRASAANEGVDVVVHGDGEQFSLVDMGPPEQNGIGCMRFYQSLPLSYYFEAYDAEVTCSDNASTLGSSLAWGPPVVVSRDRSARDVRQRLPKRYVERRYDLRQGGREVVFFFDPETVDVPPPNANKRSPAGSSVE